MSYFSLAKLSQARIFRCAENQTIDPIKMAQIIPKISFNTATVPIMPRHSHSRRRPRSPSSEESSRESKKYSFKKTYTEEVSLEIQPRGSTPLRQHHDAKNSPTHKHRYSRHEKARSPRRHSTSRRSRSPRHSSSKKHRREPSSTRGSASPSRSYQSQP